MAITTPGAIRDVLVGLVKALTPDLHSRERYILWNEGVDIRAWARAKAAACLRRFSIRFRGDTSVPLACDGNNELVRQFFDVVVSYPITGRFGGTAYGIDDFITSDLHQIRGVVGYAGFPHAYPQHAELCLILSPSSDHIEFENAVAFGVIELEIEYWRALR